MSKLGNSVLLESLQTSSACLLLEHLTSGWADHVSNLHQWNMIQPKPPFVSRVDHHSIVSLRRFPEDTERQVEYV